MAANQIQTEPRDLVHQSRVYVVFSASDDHEILGIFSTREKARDFAATFEGTRDDVGRRDVYGFDLDADKGDGPMVTTKIWRSEKTEVHGGPIIHGY